MVNLTDIFTTGHGTAFGKPAILLRRIDGHVVGWRRSPQDMREWLANMPQDEINRHASAVRHIVERKS